MAGVEVGLEGGGEAEDGELVAPEGAVERVASDAGDGSGAMRIRGGARKYDLDETSSCFEAGPYRIETIRPVYEKILREERPDLVIGDVVTLDLALPIRLAREKVIPSARVLLRVRDYTPEWSRSFIEREVEGARAITKLEEILSLLP